MSLKDWHKAIQKSSDLDSKKNDEFNELYKPVCEKILIDENREVVIGIFVIFEEIYWCEKRSNGYNRHMLIKIPSIVYNAIKNGEVRINA